MCAKVLGREAWLQGMRAGGQKQGQVDKLPPPSGPARGALGVSLECSQVLLPLEEWSNVCLP